MKMVHLQLFSLFFQATISGAITVPVFLFDNLDRVFKGQALFWEQDFKNLLEVLQGQHRGLNHQIVSETCCEIKENRKRARRGYVRAEG